MTLTVKISASIIATYSAARGLVSGAGALNQSLALALADGTAAGQADGLFSDDLDLAAGDTMTYFLSGGLVDLYGASLDFSGIKIILVQADLTNTANLVVGAGSWLGPFGDPSSSVEIKPGGSFLMFCEDATGWAVDPNADELPITCAAAATGSIVLVGISSALSVPGYSLKPEIIGTPMVGVESDCTPGDWSGLPVFSYRWRLGGTVISGASSPAYTPVPSQVGKALTRVTTASNIAGSVTVATEPVIVQAAQDGQGGVLDFSDPVNSAFVGH